MTCYSSLYNQLRLGNIFPQIKIQVQWLEIHPFTAECLSAIPGRKLISHKPHSTAKKKKKKSGKLGGLFSPENVKMKKAWFSF